MKSTVFLLAIIAQMLSSYADACDIMVERTERIVVNRDQFKGSGIDDLTSAIESGMDQCTRAGFLRSECKVMPGTQFSRDLHPQDRRFFNGFQMVIVWVEGIKYKTNKLTKEERWERICDRILGCQNKALNNDQTPVVRLEKLNLLVDNYRCI